MSRRGERREARRRNRLEASDLTSLPLTSATQLAELEASVAQARIDFLSHAGSWLGVSGFLMLVNAISQGEEPWFLIPALGWGIAIAGHASRALIALPRTLSIQRRLLQGRGALPAAGDQSLPVAALDDALGKASQVATEVAEAVARTEAHLRALDPPRIDLEAALSTAQRESSALFATLDSLDGAIARSRRGAASADRVAALVSERERIAATLQTFRVTLANLELDALLLTGIPSTQGSALHALETEAEILHAAAEGAQQAMESLGLDRRTGGRTRN